MSELKICQAREPTALPQVFAEFGAITTEFDRIGVRFERWNASQPLAADAGQEEVARPTDTAIA